MSTTGNKVAYIMDRHTQGTEMRKLQERMAAGEFQDDELAAMLETHATIISTGDVAAPNNLGSSSVSRSKTVQEDLDISMELNRQLKAMEERMAATSPMDEFHPMNRPTGSAKSAKSAKLNVIKGGKGRALKAVAAGAAAGVVTGGRGSASPANGYSPAPGRSSSNSSRTPSGMSVSQPRFRPELKNRTYTAEQQIKMRRDNVSLLSNLERIQRRGGGTDNREKKKLNHVAAASINRFKGQRTIANENTAFLKRLQSVKSTGVTGTKGSGYGRSPRKGGGRKIAGAAPPRHTGGVAHRGGGGGGGGGSRKRSKAKPEWVDLPVGPMPRV